MRMYCIFAKTSVDAMSGNRGKLAAQAGHAYLHAFWNFEDRAAIDPINGGHYDGDHIPQHKVYRDSGKAKKIALIVPTVEELEKLHEVYKKKTGVSLVKDAGLTCFKEPTITCLGIGPLYDEQIGDDLKSLKVFI